MAKTKAELKADANKYRNAVTAMRTAHRNGEFLDAIKVAMKVCDRVDGMMQFEKRFEKRGALRKSVETIGYVLEYAPLTFDRQSLEMLREVLKSQKRIDKIATDDLAADLEKAFELMWDAHRLWRLLENYPDLSPDKVKTQIGGSQQRWQEISEAWDRMGLIERNSEGSSNRISLATPITSQTRGKCPECGATGKATMGTFLDNLVCPKCKSKVLFVILPLVTPATE